MSRTPDSGGRGGTRVWPTMASESTGSVNQGTPSRRRVIAIVTPYFAPKIGGLETYALNIAKACLSRADLDVVVITSREKGRTRTTEIYEGLTVVRLPSWLRLSNSPLNPLWLWNVRQLFRHYGVDVVNTHSPVPFLADAAVLVAGARPVIMTYHAGSMRKGALPIDSVIGLYERVILPRLFRRATRIVSVSPGLLTGILAPWREKVELITPGVDTDVFRPATKTGDGVDEGGPIITFVGRLERSSQWKGISVLLEAFHILATRDEWPGLQLQLVGGGDGVSLYQEIAARLGIDGIVVFTGVLRGEDLVKAYQQSTVVVLPSTTEAESFGITLIEGMSCSKPVIGSRIGGIPFVISDGDDGLLVTPNDAESLASACALILSQPDLGVQLGAHGRRKVEERFSSRRLVERHVDLLRNAHLGPRQTVD